ncbi:MAG: cytochrome c oxidase subunit II [Cyanobacteria bacterium J06635_15]
MNIPSSIITMLAGIVVTLVSLWYGQNHGLLPIAASEEAAQVDDLFNAMMTISVGLFLLVEGALVVAAIRFRRRPGDEGDGAHIEGNVPLEILWTAIPAVIVLGISVYSFEVYTEMGGLEPMAPMQSPKTVEIAYASSSSEDSTMPLMIGDKEMASNIGIGVSPGQGEPDVTVNVMAVQYAFIFTYPDSGVVSGELYVPSGKQVKLNMNAQDVLHAFWLPELRIKQDVIPGSETELAFTPIVEGTYPVICAELCGPYHGAMKTQMVVQSPDDFNAWVQSQVALGNVADETVAAAPIERSDADYLAALAEPLSLQVDHQALAHLHSEHNHNHTAMAF